MLRLATFVACCAIAQLSSAQVYTWQPGDTSFKPLNAAGEPEEKPAGPKRILVQPQAEPSPSLKYEYHGSKLDKQPGNAVAHLLRAYVLINDSATKGAQKKWDEASSELLDQPLDRFPKDAAQEYIKATRHVLNELHEAAKSERIDYGHELNNLRGPDVFAVLLPEVQEARALARLLDVDARLAIAEGRYDDAIRTLTTGFRLAEIVSEMQPSTLIGRLVSVAITNIMLERSLELSQQPGAPNLYWALASIPDSLMDMRLAMEGEAHMLANAFHRIMKEDDVPLSDAGWQERAVRSVQDFMGLSNSIATAEPARSQQEIQARLAAGMLVLGFAETARLELQQQGFTAEQTSKMSGSEAILRSTKFGLEQSRDNFFKWGLLPRSVARAPYVNAVEAELQKAPTTPTGAIVRTLFPAVNAAGAAGDRTITKRNQLILLEALRAYAAANNGTLPDTLDELKPVPVWPHPIGSQSFEYKKLSPHEATLSRPEFYTKDQDSKWQLIVTPNK